MTTANSNKTYWIGAAMVFISAFCFALKGVLIKSVYQYGVSTIALLSLRLLFALPFYLAVLGWRYRKDKTAFSLPQKQWSYVLLFSFLGYYLSAFLNFEGLHYVTASLERVLLFIYPTFVLLINLFRFKKKITGLQLVVLGVTYAGIAIAFVQNIDAAVQKNLALGAFFVIFSGFTYAIYMVGSDKLIGQLGSLNYTCLSMILATIPSVLHAWVQEGGLYLFHFDGKVYGIIAFMAVVSTVIPTFTLAEGIKRVGSGNAAIINSIGPIFTIVLATTVLDEQISFWQLVGTTLVLLGVLLIGWKGKK